MSEKQQLNEKLARWAGFEQRDNSPFGLLPKKKLTWWTPDDNWIGMDLPDFTNSLDACFQWLVPKLEVLDGIALYETTNGWFVELNTHYMADTYEAEAETLALALCLAIEKLI